MDLPACNNWADIGLPEVYFDPDLASFNGAVTQTSADDQGTWSSRPWVSSPPPTPRPAPSTGSPTAPWDARVRRQPCTWRTDAPKCGPSADRPDCD